MTLQSVLGCQVCSALEKQSVPRSKVFFGAKCASAASKLIVSFFSGFKGGLRKYIILVLTNIEVITILKLLPASLRQSKTNMN